MIFWVMGLSEVVCLVSKRLIASIFTVETPKDGGCMFLPKRICSNDFAVVGL
jgi:hypothetical protein